MKRIRKNAAVLNDIVVCDIETTGLNPGWDDIIQIGAVRLIKRNKMEGTFLTYVKPERKIPDEIIRMTGIDENDVENAPGQSEALSNFSRFCGGSMVAAHNGKKFDFVFMHTICYANGIKTKKSLCLDTIHLSRQIWGRDLVAHGLEPMARRLGIRTDHGLHQADFDSKLLAKCLIKLLDFSGLGSLSVFGYEMLPKTD